NDQGLKVVGISLPILGALAGAGAISSFTRSADADSVAEIAAAQVSEPDHVAANKACNLALSSWSKSRSNSNKELIDALKSKPPNPELKAAIANFSKQLEEVNGKIASIVSVSPPASPQTAVAPPGARSGH